MNQSAIPENFGTIPIAEIIQMLEQPDGSSALELRVNIEGQDLPILLPLDALASFEETDQAVGMELRKIREILSRLEGSVPYSGPEANEIAVSLLNMIDATYRLPKRETG